MLVFNTPSRDTPPFRSTGHVAFDVKDGCGIPRRRPDRRPLRLRGRFGRVLGGGESLVLRLPRPRGGGFPVPGRSVRLLPAGRVGQVTADGLPPGAVLATGRKAGVLTSPGRGTVVCPRTTLTHRVRLISSVKHRTVQSV